MKASLKMKKEYENMLKNVNNFHSFYHTMDIERYRIDYKNYFSNNRNILFEQDFAESNFDFEAEDIFVDWLNEE